MFSLALFGFLLQSVLDLRLESLFWQRRNELEQGQDAQRYLVSTVDTIQNATIATKNTSTVVISNDYNETIVRMEEESTKDNDKEDIWITINGWKFQPNRLPFPPIIRGNTTGSNSLNVIVDQYRHDWKAKNFSKKQRRRHPYRASRDEFGNLGYVANAKAHLLPQNQRSLALLQVPMSKMLVETNDQHNETAVAIAIAAAEAATAAAAKYLCSPPTDDENWLTYYVSQHHIQIAAPLSSAMVATVPHRIMCAVYTHGGNTVQTEAIRQTWGRRCDGLLFLSTVTNHTTLHVQMPHASRYEGQYNGLWQRTRSILAYLYMHYMEDYDYFHISGDDTFVIVENLRHYLTSPEIANLTLSGQPFFGGFWTKWKEDDTYPDFYYLGGGSGYTLNVPALKKYMEDGPMEHCIRNRNDGSAEDVHISWCFRNVSGVLGWDTRDENGAHRYHVMSLYEHASFPARRFRFKSLIVERSLTFMQETHRFPKVYGRDFMSPYSVAFHFYKPFEQMQRMEYWLYGNAEIQEVCKQYVEQESKLI